MLEDMLEDICWSFHFIIVVIFFIFLNLTNTKFKHVTSTFYHGWFLVFEFATHVTYFPRVIDIQCMHLYLVYPTLNIPFRVLIALQP